MAAEPEGVSQAMAAGQLEFRILGPPAVLVDGRELPLSAKERAVIAALVVDAGRVVSVDRLIGALWEDNPPDSAVGSLRVHLSRARKALADAGIEGRIVTRDAGYSLVLEPGDVVDADVFASLVRAADEAAALGDADRAHQLLEDALGRWHGPALGDLGDVEFGRADAARLEEARLAAVSARVDADLARGRHFAVVGDLESLCRDHPLHERFWAQLMVALYRSGRQADALRAYQTIRDQLRDELGLDPSPELVRLEADILSQAPTLDVERARSSAVAQRLPSGVVSFVLTDVEGSTKLWDAAPEAMAKALARHDELVRTVVEGHGGTLLKAKGEGDSTVSVFPRASDAVAAAANLQRSISDEPWPSETRLRVRIGVHTGEAHERDGDFFGPTVNRAARIRALASGGEVLLSHAAAELVHDRLPDGTMLVPLGAHRLAGVSRVEQVFALASQEPSGLADDDEAPAASIPLPAPVSTRPAVFVGRDAEIGTLEAAWARAQRDQRETVLVVGEPGIGKTSLVGELARDAHAKGGLVLFGHCDEESLVPFQPFVEALAHWVTSAPVGEVRAVLGAQASDLALLVPEVRQRLSGIAEASGAGAETERYRLFEAVPAALIALSKRAPVLLVLDDLHWADGPTLQLLVHTIRKTAGSRLLTVGTYRDTDLFRTHPLADALAELRRLDAVQRLVLRGLARDDVLALLCRDREPDPSDETFADALWRETEGSPLFLRESIRHLEETGSITQDEVGGWRARRPIDAIGIPEGIKEVIGRRLTRLTEDTNAALRLGSVMGREFSVDVVQAVNGWTEDQVFDALDPAVAAGIVSEVEGRIGRYSFTHALVREALYDEQSIARRVRMHQRVGQAIESRYADQLDSHLTELAFHFTQSAVAGDSAKAIEYARRAGDEAMASVAYEEAVRLYGTALEVLEDSVERDELRRVEADLLLRIGRAHWRAGAMDIARATFERTAALARELADPALLGNAALAFAGAEVRAVWVLVGEVDVDGVALLEEALEVLPPEDSEVRARVLACLAAQLHFVPGAAVRCDELSRDAVAMARRVNDSAALAYVLATRNLAVLGVASAPERLANADEVIEIAETLGDRALEAFGHAHRYFALTDLDDMPGAKTAAARLGELAGALKDPLLMQADANATATFAIMEGRLAEADEFTTAGLRIGQDGGEPSAPLAYFGPTILLRRFQGSLGGIAAALDGLEGSFPITPGLIDGIVPWLFAEAGHPAAAERVAQLSPDFWMASMADTWAMVGLARAARIVGDANAAAWIHERLLPVADRNASIGGNILFGCVAHALAITASVLDRPEESAERFEDALRRYERNGWWPLWAEAAIQYAGYEEAPIDAARRHDLVERALQLATHLGLPIIETEARQLLGQLDGTKRDAPSPLPALTRRDKVRGKITTRGRQVVAHFVGNASDADLVRRFGSTRALKLIFSAMAHAFQPAMAFGFEGALAFDVRVPAEDGTFQSEWFTIEVTKRRAAAHHRPSAVAAVTVHLDLPDFLRMAAGDMPIDALMRGRIQCDGDLILLIQAAAMFGAVEPYEVVGGRE